MVRKKSLLDRGKFQLPAVGRRVRCKLRYK
jgi:hypothetical protein